MCSYQYAAVLLCCRCTDPQCLNIAKRPVYIRNNITRAPVMASNISLNKSGFINSLGLISSAHEKHSCTTLSLRYMRALGNPLSFCCARAADARNQPKCEACVRSGPPTAEHDSVRGILKDDVH